MGGFQGTGLPNIKMLSSDKSASVAAPGVIVTEQAVGLNSMRVQVAGAADSNVVTLFGTLDGINWVPVGSVVGNNAPIFDTQAYEKLRLETTNYGGTPFDISWQNEAHPAAFGIIGKIGKNGDQAMVTAVQSGDTTAADISLHDHEGNPYTTLNPLPTTAVLENPHTVVATIVTAGVPITITAPDSAPIRAFSLYAPRVGPNAGTNSINRYVIYSTDSGSTYKTLPVNEWIAEPGLVTDLRIDASHNGMKVEVEIRY